MLGFPEYSLSQFVAAEDMLKFRGYVTSLARTCEEFKPDLSLTGDKLDHALNTWVYSAVEAANHPEVFDFEDIHLHAIVGIWRCNPEYKYVIAPKLWAKELPDPYSQEAINAHSAIDFILEKLGIWAKPTIDFIAEQGIDDPNDPRLLEYLKIQASTSVAWQQFPRQG